MLSRRWVALSVAALTGFVASGATLSPATMVTLLAILFVAVFLVALAISMLTEPSPVEQESGAADAGTTYSEASSVQGEAIYGSP